MRVASHMLCARPPESMPSKTLSFQVALRKVQKGVLGIARPSTICTVMDLLNSYDDDESPPVTSTSSFTPVRPVHAGWFH
jgi:hypothetical protein